METKAFHNDDCIAIAVTLSERDVHKLAQNKPLSFSIKKSDLADDVKVTVMSASMDVRHQLRTGGVHPGSASAVFILGMKQLNVLLKRPILVRLGLSEKIQGRDVWAWFSNGKWNHVDDVLATGVDYACAYAKNGRSYPDR
jgi:hypothetical protein